MSAFDRLPENYRKLCKAVAGSRFPRHLGGIGGAKAWLVPISPRNRNVRHEADRLIAGAKTFPNVVTRQQRRFAARRGIAL